MGQSHGVILKEVSAFRRCSLIEVVLYNYRKKFTARDSFIMSFHCA